MKPNTRSTTPTPKAPFLMEVGWGDDHFFDDIDKAFQNIQRKTRTLSSKKDNKTKRINKISPSSQRGVSQMQKTYLEVSKVHLQPVLRYLKTIQQGYGSKEVCDLVSYVMEPMVRKTKQTGLEKETIALLNFHKELKKTTQQKGKKIDSIHRENLIQTFGFVQKLFRLEFRGHTPAVVNLLGFLKILRKNRKFSDQDIRKLFGIGIPSLTMLRKSSVEELSSLSGIDSKTMSQIRSEARSHRLS